MVAIAKAISTTRAGNFKFTYTRAGNLHTCVLANAIADLLRSGKSIIQKLFNMYGAKFETTVFP